MTMRYRSVVFGAVVALVFTGTSMARPETATRGGPAASGSQDDAMPEGSFAVTGVKVFDGEAFRPDRDVWVEDGRVRAVGPASPGPEGLARVDGGGRTLVPGLIDGHVHTFGSTLSDAVRFGVTSVLDQFTHPALAASKRAARETLARGDEADLFTAGMLATTAGGHGTQFGVPMEPVAGPADAADWVRARKAEGSDWIKIAYEDGSTFGADIPSLDGGTIRALIAAAHAEGLLAVVHVSTLVHALEVIDLGADGLVHVWGDAVVDEAQAARIAEAGAFVVPTLSVVTAMSGDGVGRELLEDASGALLSRMQRETLANRYPDLGDAARSAAPAARGATAIENVRRLRAAGIRLLAGTDAPNPGTAPGISMHGELRLLRRAGLSSAEALAAATSTPAAIFGLEDRGRIEAGLLADLVLVDGDLEADVSASSRIAAVWKDGARYLGRLLRSSHTCQLVEEPCDVPYGPSLVFVEPVGIEVHDVVPQFPNVIEALHELHAVDSEIQAFPVVGVLQQPTESAECQIGRTFDELVFGGRRQLIKSELAVNEISQVSLDLADEEEQLGELSKLVGQICRRHHPGDDPVITSHEHVPVFRDDADGIEEPGGARNHFRWFHAIADVLAFTSQCESSTN